MSSSLGKMASKALSALDKEASVLEELHGEVQAAIDRMESKHPGLKELLRRARGYAVFPSVGKAAAVVGVAFGKGEVFDRGRLVGYAGLVQATLGVQLGGQTFSEIITFKTKQALERFKQGRMKFAANASVALVKAGAAASVNLEPDAAVFVDSEGGLFVDADIGTQKFVVNPAFLGRGRWAGPARTVARTDSGRRARNARNSRPRPVKHS